MSESILKAAACTRALLHRASPDESFSDDRIFHEFLKDQEAALIELASRPDAVEILSVLSERAVREIGVNGGEIGSAAAHEAEDLVAGAHHNSDMVVAGLVVFGVLGTVTVAAMPAILLAIRVGRIRHKNGKFEADFFQGVDEGARDLVLGVVRNATSFDRVVKQLHPSNDDLPSQKQNDDIA